VAIAAATGVSTKGAVAAGAITLVQELAVAQMEGNQERAAWTLKLSADMAGLTPYQLAARVREDPRLLRLATAVLEAAGDTVLEAKVRRLAALLAEGLRDLDAADVSMLHVSVVADLEVPHLHVMELLSQQPPPSDTANSPARGWDRGQLLIELPSLGATVDIVLAVLSRHGLIFNVAAGTWGAGGHEEERFELTDVGEETLRELHAAGPALRDADV